MKKRVGDLGGPIVTGNEHEVKNHEYLYEDKGSGKFVLKKRTSSGMLVVSAGITEEITAKAKATLDVITPSTGKDYITKVTVPAYEVTATELPTTNILDYCVYTVSSTKYVHIDNSWYTLSVYTPPVDNADD